MDQQIGHNYQTRVGVAQLASMPTLPNCHTYSSLLSKDYGTEAQVRTNNYMESCAVNDFITRKRSFYVLAAMLVIGIAVNITQSYQHFYKFDKLLMITLIYLVSQLSLISYNPFLSNIYP